MNKSIFRSYDIRGVYPEDLSEKTAFKLGRAFVGKTEAKNVVVGRDMRLSSPDLFSALAKGIASSGADVYNIGEVPTEALYFASAYYKYDAGIMITASHNPKEYNGFKMVKRGEDAMEVVRGEEMAGLSGSASPDKAGEVKELSIWEDFISHLFSFGDAGRIGPLKAVVDASSGMAGKALPRILESLPLETVNLNFSPDGNFPCHSPNPLDEKSQAFIKSAVQKEKADLGFIFDGDGDRIFLVDEKGEFKRGDITLLLLAKHLLAKNPGKGIVYNVMSSRAVPDFIKKWGGKPVRTPVGFVNIREGLIKNEGILGGEVSGHYSFRDNFYFDSGLISFLLLLEIVSESDLKVSELTSDYSVYPRRPELNFKVKDKEKALEKIKDAYSDGKQDFLDGVTVEYEDWWFNARPSNTEPLLRVAIEADNEKLLKEKEKELREIIGPF